MRDRDGDHPIVSGVRVTLALTTGWLLFGDWSALGISQLLSGASGNWLLYTTLVQVSGLLAALLLGRLRGALWTLPMLCWAGIALLLSAHVLALWFDDRQLDDYAVQKVAGWLVLCGPALLLGIALGREAHLPPRPRSVRRGAHVPGPRLGAGAWFLLLTLPLCAMCVTALVVDPRYLTIASYWNPMLFFGWLVLPAHQALAYCLAKQTLFAAALATQREPRESNGSGPDVGRASRRGAWRRRAPYLLLVGGLSGLVLLTGARGYIFATVAAVAAVLMFGRRRIGGLLVTAAIGSLLFQTLAPSLVQERLDPTLAMQSASYSEREQAWSGAIEAWRQSPLVGQGPGGYSTFMNWSGRAYAHNLPLEFASELGTVGLLLFATMLLTAAAPIVRAWRRAMQLNVVQAFAVGFFVFSLLGSMVIGDWIRNAFLFLAIGMVHASLRAPVGVHVHPNGRAPLPLPALPLPPCTPDRDTAARGEGSAAVLQPRTVPGRATVVGSAGCDRGRLGEPRPSRR